MLRRADKPGDNGAPPVPGSSSVLGVWLKEKLGSGGGARRAAGTSLPSLKSILSPSRASLLLCDGWRRLRETAGPDIAGRAGKTKGGFGSGAS